MGFDAASAVLSSTEESAATPRLSGDLDGSQLLVPLLTADVPVVTDQLRIAGALARATEATLYVVDPVAGSDQSPTVYEDGFTDGDEAELLEWATETASSRTARGHGPFRFTRKLVNGVLETIRTHDVDTLVVPSGSSTGLLRHGVTERLALRADCDVVTVNGKSGYEPVPSILLPVAGGPHSGMACDVARSLAEECDAWIDVLHVVDEDASEREREAAEEVVEGATRRINHPDATSTWVMSAEDAAAAIIEQSAYYGLTVVGAPTNGRLRRFLAGSTNQTIRDSAESVVLSVRNNE